FLAETPGSDLLANRNDLYNGNIGWMVTNIQVPKGLDGATGPLGMSYQYDQLNRLREARGFENLDTVKNLWLYDNNYADEYYNEFHYDGNGNILEQQRFDRQ